MGAAGGNAMNRVVDGAGNKVGRNTFFLNLPSECYTELYIHIPLNLVIKIGHPKHLIRNYRPRMASA